MAQEAQGLRLGQAGGEATLSASCLACFFLGFSQARTLPHAQSVRLFPAHMSPLTRALLLDQDMMAKSPCQDTRRLKQRPNILLSTCCTCHL